MSEHRRVTFVSDVDRHLLERGIAPSWKDRVTGEDQMAGRDAPDPEDTAWRDPGEGANDRRLADNVPPHSQARI